MSSVSRQISKILAYFDFAFASCAQYNAPLTSMLKILSDPIQINRFLQLGVRISCFLSVCHQINTKPKSKLFGRLSTQNLVNFKILSWISAYWWHWKIVLKSGNKPLICKPLFLCKFFWLGTCACWSLLHAGWLCSHIHTWFVTDQFQGCCKMHQYVLITSIMGNADRSWENCDHFNTYDLGWGGHLKKTL